MLLYFKTIRSIAFVILHRSSVLELQRLSGYDGASRILCISSDNSLRLLSPLSGHTLITGFPILRNSEPVKTVYDLHTGKNKISFSKTNTHLVPNYSERIFVLLKSGQLAVYGCESNPMCVLSEWELYSKSRPFPSSSFILNPSLKIRRRSRSL